MVHHQHTQPMELKTPVRNRYFYGKLLDVFHFELEQSYFNAKRWRLNRRVFGFGVICGLDVQLVRRPKERYCPPRNCP